MIIFFSVTGALIAYERPVLRAADHHFYPPPAPAGDTRIPLVSLIAGVPGIPESLTIYSEPARPVEVQTKSHDLYLIDPYSGTVHGPASPHLRAFFSEVTALHRWFGLSNASHASATAVKGAVVLLFLLVLVTGPILWIPKRWSRRAVTGGILPRFAAQSRARNYNWHRVTGFWVGPPLTIIVITGIVMAYPWANAVLFRIAGNPGPARPGGGTVRGRESPTESPKAVLPGRLDEAFAQATNGIDGWRSASLWLAHRQTGLAFAVDRSEGGHPEKSELITLDPLSLRVVHKEPFAALSRGQRWRRWVRFIHTGEAGGWWGEGLALISALGAVVLAVTGLALSYDRLRRWQRHP